ncbi:8-amino-7-oxononanoate synthase [Streptomyces gardneri]|uniref:8-amino-7-oxononanoate synthase n=1 Tax=Streptomyces gardneri TaxID=66892 RepID=UPI0036902599
MPASPKPDRPASVFAWLHDASAARAAAGMTRTPRIRREDETTLDLASNDYLGLARHPAVTRAAADAALLWGGGSTGSRLVCGSTHPHTELEQELADFCGFESALVFSSGYTANLAAVTALSDADTLIVSDANNHASLIDGCRLSRAHVLRAVHDSPAAVREVLSRRAHAKALVLSDSVFSVDGNLAQLRGLSIVARAHGAGLIVDDAHGFGVLGDGGRGALAHAGLAGRSDTVATVTLSKALGSQGGAVLGPRPVIEHLIQTARTFIFDTALAPAAVGAALSALRLLRAEPWRARRVRRVAETLATRLGAAGLRVSTPDGAVVSVLAPSPDEAARWAADCLSGGIAVGCFRPPSVPDGISRLRLAARADLDDRQIAAAVEVLTETAPQAAFAGSTTFGASVSERSSE